MVPHQYKHQSFYKYVVSTVLETEWGKDSPVRKSPVSPLLSICLSLRNALSSKKFLISFSNAIMSISDRISVGQGIHNQTII